MDPTPLEIMAELAKTWSPTSMGDPEVTEQQLDLFSDDLVIIEPASLPHGGRHQGMAEYRKLQDAMSQRWEQAIESAEYWQCADDRVALRIVIKWTARNTGKSIVLPMIDFMRFADGKIVEVEAFLFDTKSLLDTLE